MGGIAQIFYIYWTFMTDQSMSLQECYNFWEILKISNVDGVLVGGASLKIKDFLAIYGSAVKHLKKITTIKD